MGLFCALDVTLHRARKTPQMSVRSSGQSSLRFILTFLVFLSFTEINSSSDTPPTYKEFLLKPFDDISIIDLHTEAFNIEMEYFIPYARLKNAPQSGMQLTAVKRTEQAPSANVTSSVVSTNVISSKKVQKHALNQQFSNVKGSEIEFSPTKMSKKQLKVAQDQLKKLTKINIHLSGKFITEFLIVKILVKCNV